MPCSAMQKLIVVYGCMLRCAWLPPEFVIAAADIATGWLKDNGFLK